MHSDVFRRCDSVDKCAIEFVDSCGGLFGCPD